MELPTQTTQINQLNNEAVLYLPLGLSNSIQDLRFASIHQDARSKTIETDKVLISHVIRFPSSTSINSQCRVDCPLFVRLLSWYLSLLL